MRDGLAREFPEAVRGLDWLRGRAGERRPLVFAEPVVWATVSGIGAGFLVASISQALVGVAGEVLQALRAPMPFALFPVVTILGTAAGAAVALTAGGLVALTLDIAYVALGIVLGIPGRMFACDRSGGVPPFPGPDQCTALGFLASLWPQLMGLGLGIVVARSLVARGEGINSVLRIAGGLAVALFTVSHAWTAVVAQRGFVADSNSASALSSTLTVGAGMVAAAVAAGVVAAQLPRGIRNAAIVAGIWMLPWLTLLPSSLQSAGNASAELVGSMVIVNLVPPVAAASLVLSAATASRARFVPREPA
jgi:hypothetical protein